MRQQLHNAQVADSRADDLETDLGWNDMGFDAADAGPSDVVPFVRDEAPVATAPVPEVRRAQIGWIGNVRLVG